MVDERFSSAFQLFKRVLDAIPILVGDLVESEIVMVAYRFQPRCSVNQNDRGVDEVFLAEFCENISVSAVVLVGNNRICSKRFVSGSTAAYRQYR